MTEIIAGFVIVFLFFNIGDIIGTNSENTRIYEQCIKDNDTKTVVDATELCKTLTR